MPLCNSPCSIIIIYVMNFFSHLSNGHVTCCSKLFIMYNRSTIVVYLLSVSHVRSVCKLQIKTLKVSILTFDSPQRFVQWRISFYGTLYILLQFFFRTQKFADAFAFYYLHKARDGTGLFSHSYLIEISFVKSCRN